MFCCFIYKVFYLSPLWVSMAVRMFSWKAARKLTRCVWGLRCTTVPCSALIHSKWHEWHAEVCACVLSPLRVLSVHLLQDYAPLGLSVRQEVCESVRVWETELLRQEVEGIAGSVSTLPRLKAQVPGATDKKSSRITEELRRSLTPLGFGVCCP